MNCFKFLVIRLVFLAVLVCSTVTSAAGHNWEWFDANDNFGKYLDIESIKINRSIYTKSIESVDAWVKLAYSYAGAVVEVDGYDVLKKKINPADLSYSLLQLSLDPQNGKVTRKQIVFYDKDGNSLGSVSKSLTVYADSNSLYGEFYYRIMDKATQRNDYKMYKENDYMRLINESSSEKGKIWLMYDLLSIRESDMDVSVDVYYYLEGNDGNIDLVITREVHDKVKPEWKSRIIYSGDNRGLNNMAGYQPEKYHTAIPDSKGEQMHDLIIKYAKENSAFINRYK